MRSSVSKAAFLLVQHKICQFLVIKYYFRVLVSQRVVVRDVDEILPSLTGKCRHHVSNDVDSTCGGCPRVADLAMVWVADAVLLPIVMTARMWVRCLGYLKYRWSL